MTGIWSFLLWIELLAIVLIALTWRKRPACPWCGERWFCGYRRRRYRISDQLVAETNLLECDRCRLAERAPA